MKVLKSILREMADLPEDTDALADAMNRLGMAVESVDVIGARVPGVVTAKILRTEKHPDAAKVTRCWVDAGDGQERHVWCGATNMGPGDVVPLATLGTVMPDGREISRRGILGIDSEGMLCSATELGVPGDGSGLLLLDRSLPLGVDLWDALGIDSDVVFDLDLTRNRPDCWGHLGVARDLAAHFSAHFRGPVCDDAPRGTAESVSVEVADSQRCAMFSVWRISGVTVGPSPGVIASRLEALGMRSINNVVDASNLAMLETNQPNHAYDARVVSSFRVRCARDGESIVTLDGVERTLHEDDLLICDGVSDEPVGLAGVMGDAHSEINEKTTELSLEIAWFEPDGIRFAAQRHGLRTEASLRFERGVDPNGHELCARRFVALLRQSNPDIVLHAGETVVRTDSCPGSAAISVSTARASALLGVSITQEQIVELITPLGFDCVVVDDDQLTVTTPSWRPDCTLDVDIIEEVARHYGYERIGKTMPKSPVHGRLSEVQRRRRLVREVMVGLGFDEAMPSPFLAPGDTAQVGLDESDVLSIENPLVTEESVLRTSLRPGLLKTVAYNLSHRADRIDVFEIGHVYPRGSGPLPDEAEFLAVVSVGSGVERVLDVWSALADALQVGALLDQKRVPVGMHAARSASLTRGKNVIGVVGEVDPMVLRSMGISTRVALCEVNLSVLLREQPKPVTAKDINRFPSSDLDLAFVVDDGVPAQDLARALRQAAGSRLVSCVLFDVYRGPGVSEGSRSLAFRLRLQEVGSTLTDDVIANVQQACIGAAAKLGATLRA